jgi:quinol monooxygenase YgiN
VQYAVVATYRVKPGTEEAVRAALEQMTRFTRREPGCRYYQAHRSLENPRVFFLYELYDDEEAFQAHAASEHFERYIKNQVWLAMEERTRLLGAPVA